MKSIWIGFDPRETAAYAVARQSINTYLTQQIPVYGVVLDELKRQGLYWRPTERRDGKLYDVIQNMKWRRNLRSADFWFPISLREDGRCLWTATCYCGRILFA